jgi:16S rRNA (cytosine967-C5)-methyltransferase
MRAGSILGILLELLAELERAGPLPADAAIGRFFRARRYLGAQDRRAIGGLAWAYLRHRPRGEARWDAWALRSGLPPARDLAGREAALAPLIALARDGLLSWTVPQLLDAVRDLRAPAGPPWDSIAARTGEPDALGPLDWPPEPMARLAAELSLPEWFARRLLAERGEDAARRLGASLLEEAPVDLRVNRSRIGREEAAAALEREVPGCGVRPTPFSPLGLRLPGRRNIGAFLSAHPGWIEVQDEGSQLVALAADPGPDDIVIDACAGAGGKTLALLDLRDARKGRGRMHACDVSDDRLRELDRRAQLLDVRALAIHRIDTEGPLPPGLPAAADLVLVDAPCSGSGTLRRSPELKYRYGPEALSRFAGLQGRILRRFAPLVRPGGRLVYATCSLFEEENGAVVDAFLAERGEFAEVRPEAVAAILSPAAYAGLRLRLDPAATGTDGYFLAAMARKVSVLQGR